MSDRKLPIEAQILIKAKKLIENPDDWCPEGFGQNGVAFYRGKMQLCAVRALAMMIQGCNERKAEEILIKVAGGGSSDAIIRINSQGHKAVMNLYDQAIAIAIKGGNND